MELADRVGRDVRLISISVDPVTDVPARLKTYAEKFGAGPGWSFVAGRKADVRALLTALGVPAGNPDAHTPTILVGNAAAGYWRRASGLGSPSTIAAMINDAAARAPRARPAPAENPAARQASSYFPNLVLSTQDGAAVRFLMQDPAGLTAQ
jgi:protein SCO1/2